MATDYSMFSPVDFNTNISFTGEIGSGIPGLDFMNWGLSGLDSSEFMTNPQFERGLGSIAGLEAYRRSSGEEGTGFDLNKLFSVLDKNNYSLREYSPVDSNTRWSAVFDNSTNMPLAEPQKQTLTSSGDRLALALASTFLNPFGGIAVGGAAGGLGGTLASGTTAAAINGAASGGLNSFVNGGSLGDIFKAAAMGGSGAYMPDIGGYLGVNNNYLRDGINSAIKSGAMAKLNGGDVGQSAFMSALPAAGSYLANIVSPMPDVGTIGGNMQDDVGENTVTMGSPTSTQYGTNMQAMSADNTLSLPVQSSMAAPNSSGSNDLMSQVSNLIAGITPNRVGDVVQGLAGLYMGNRQRRMARDIKDRIMGNRGSYEQQLRQNLARRDAASGRRSDYAGRETQLQAALAELDSRTAPILSQLDTMSLGGLNQMFNSGLVTGNRLGWWGQQPTAPSMSTQMPSLSTLGTTGPTASYSLIDNQNKNRYRLGGG